MDNNIYRLFGSNFQSDLYNKLLYKQILKHGWTLAKAKPNHAQLTQMFQNKALWTLLMPSRTLAMTQIIAILRNERVRNETPILTISV